MSFNEVYATINQKKVHDTIDSFTAAQIKQALFKRGKLTVDDFLALISPAAAPFLEEMANRSHNTTLKRFGRTIALYAPIYLSSECANSCLYCGFNKDAPIPRVTLSEEEIHAEAQSLKNKGFDNILLVTGESPGKVNIDYLERAVTLLRQYFSFVSIEVQPLEKNEYLRLIRAGVDGVTSYQETYHQERYRHYHPKGKKARMEYRLETADRAASATIRQMGLGVLLGLSDWRVDSYMVAAHLDYLKKRYWRTRWSVSVPRLRPAGGAEQVEFPVSDRELVQLICAYRIWDENLGIVLSTRESPQFRNHTVPLGITMMSAGSCTEPGGYSLKKESGGQFDVFDARPPAEVAFMIRQSGYEPVWKDWDSAFHGELKKTLYPESKVG